MRASLDSVFRFQTKPHRQVYRDYQKSIHSIHSIHSVYFSVLKTIKNWSFWCHLLFARFLGLHKLSTQVSMHTCPGVELGLFGYHLPFARFLGPPGTPNQVSLTRAMLGLRSLTRSTCHHASALLLARSLLCRLVYVLLVWKRKTEPAFCPNNSCHSAKKRVIGAKSGTLFFVSNLSGVSDKSTEIIQKVSIVSIVSIQYILVC